MILDSEGLVHGINIEVVGTDEREGLVLLLQLIKYRANHLLRPLLRAIFLAISGNSDEYVVARLCGEQIRDARSESIPPKKEATM